MDHPTIPGARSSGAIGRILYLAVGDPHHPRIGIDIVVREHLDEIARRRHFAMSGVVVSLPPSPCGSMETGACGEPKSASWANVDFVVGDQAHSLKRRQVAKQKLKLLLRGKPLMMLAFDSSKARRSIKRELAKAPDLVVVDHINATVNLSLWDLIKHSDRIVLVAHDNNFRALTDAARLSRSWLKKGLLFVQALQLGALELFLVRKARCTIFLSEFDRRDFDALTPRLTITLCPAPRARIDVSRTKPLPSPSALFIGSPSFAPNAMALRWLLEQFAPCLLRTDSRVQIMLVGAGIEAWMSASVFANPAPPNVRPLGFVSEERLQELLLSCVALLSPVVHGSGIKIKVLQAFALGCPVLATEESLRGFEFMRVAPRIELSRPEVAAKELAQLAQSPAQQRLERAHIQSAWQCYAEFRKDKLSDALTGYLPEI